MQAPESAPVDLVLSPDADREWTELVRPWLLGGRGLLRSSLVVVPTRGHAHALKRRCLVEGIALLGVEFLTPGLARKKWLAHLGRSLVPAPPAMAKELLVLGLRSLIQRRILSQDDPAQGVWRSLESDLERVLSDFEELLQGGFSAEDFPLPPLREVFSELTRWVEDLGYCLGPRQAESAGLTPLPAGAAPLTDRLLLLAGGAESRADFFSLAALARRIPAVTVILDEPEIRSRESPDEGWVDMWQAILGVEARVLDVDPPDTGCGPVGLLWGGEGGSAVKAQLLVGHSRTDEMALVAHRIEQLLSRGASNLAVIFPSADPAHLLLVRQLEARGILFSDLVGTVSGPSIDILIQRSVADFYGRGCRIEELVELISLLRSLNQVAISAGEARDACERLFSEAQTHSVAVLAPKLTADHRAAWKEVGRIAEILLPAWPDKLTVTEALARFETVRDRFGLVAPTGWGALAAFASRCSEVLPAQAILSAIRAFLPEKAPVSGRRAEFSRVTLTTRRRAAGVAWSHAIFVESNRGIWPEAFEPSCWLGDEDRKALSSRGRFSVGLLSSEERAALERKLCHSVARNTRHELVFSAALFDEAEPDRKLSPNVWFERVMWEKGLLSSGTGQETVFDRMARSRPRLPPEAGDWIGIWNHRRDPKAPFDEFFFGQPLSGKRPVRLPARLIEQGVRDPVCLWFEAILGIRRIEWKPFERTRKKSLGQEAHRMLALSLAGTPAEGPFKVFPSPEHARGRLAEVLASHQSSRPSDRYWESFNAELGSIASSLLEQALTLFDGPFVAVEVSLPEGASVPIGELERLSVHGRMDLVISDIPQWLGARLNIVDFKTGSDRGLSAARMSRTGASLQLGVYLAAVQSLEAADGAVWMLKDGAPATALRMAELPQALAVLEILGQQLSKGIYGALTPDRNEHTPGFEWPLACAPIGYSILESKFAATFGVLPFFRKEDEGGD